MTQPELDFTDEDVCRSKHGGEEHSEAANLAATHSKSLQQDKIILVLGKHYSMTREEIQEKVPGLLTQSAAARCAEMKRDGLAIVITSRAGKSGVKAGVLALTDKGWKRYAGIRARG